ncbi:hypothetical protein [Neobacillus vireti]|uniref:hypothetical protein n=1 Tax=Neobacillus vireti TaxID=220686 RepID=UPI002FFFAB04
MKKKLLIGISISLILLLSWWSKYLFFVPHFQPGPNNTLISKNAKLVLVPDPERLGIHEPNFIPFWKTIGVVDGEMKGTLWGFTDKGKKYVSYYHDGEMVVGSIYRYSH